MNFEKARYNMIEQQVRPWNVLDQRVLDLMGELPREDFVPDNFRKLAYSDTMIPLDSKESEYLLPPREVGRIIQSLHIKPTDTVLEIGTGTGYMTALLAQLAKTVTSTELEAQYLSSARKLLEQLAINNVHFLEVDGLLPGNTSDKFDVICITGALVKVPEPLLEKLTVGGRLLAVVGNAPAMSATLFTRVDEEQFHEEVIYETVLPYLKHIQQPSTFKF